MEKTNWVTSNQLPCTLDVIAVCTGFSSLLLNMFHRVSGETALQLNASRGHFSRNLAKTSCVSLFCYYFCYPSNLSLKHLLLVLLEFKLPCLDTAQSCTHIPRLLLPSAALAQQASRTSQDTCRSSDTFCHTASPCPLPESLPYTDPLTPLSVLTALPPRYYEIIYTFSLLLGLFVGCIFFTLLPRTLV